MAMTNAWKVSKRYLDICDYIIKFWYVADILLLGDDEMQDVNFRSESELLPLPVITRLLLNPRLLQHAHHKYLCGISSTTLENTLSIT